jgi:hypothetical protein
MLRNSQVRFLFVLTVAALVVAMSSTSAIARDPVEVAGSNGQLYIMYATATEVCIVDRVENVVGIFDRTLGSAIMGPIDSGSGYSHTLVMSNGGTILSCSTSLNGAYYTDGTQTIP